MLLHISLSDKTWEPLRTQLMLFYSFPVSSSRIIQHLLGKHPTPYCLTYLTFVLDSL